MMWPGMMGWHMGLGAGFGWLFMFGFWVLVIFGIIAAIRWSGGQIQANPVRKSGESAIEILEKRYAGGELSIEDFRRMKKDILKGGD